jgi:hypothetical protein
MVDVSKLKSKSRLGSPPEAGEAKNNLRQPDDLPEITDGRSLRATGRTAQLATRIKPESLQLLRQLAARDRVTMAEVIERALDLYASRLLAPR